MIEWFWLGFNGILGIPLALIVWIFFREGIRTLVAIAFGFRVFEIRWGVGETRFESAVGPVTFRLGTWPFGGETLARSGVPRRHRVARAALALAPLTAQFLWLADRMAHSPPAFESLRSGLAPLAVLDLANFTLLAVHCVFPNRFSCGSLNDLRMLLNSVLKQFDSDRTARASYYARLSMHHLERADVEAAQESLSQGLLQLGREPILVRCQQRLQQCDLASVIDQGDCVDELRLLIEEVEPSHLVGTAKRTAGERLSEAALSALPAAFLLLVVAISQTDKIALQLETQLQKQSERIASQGDPASCGRQTDRWISWTKTTDALVTLEAPERRDRHATLAKLARCQGDLDLAATHQGEALLAASAAGMVAPPGATLEPGAWWANEMRTSELLRQAADVESERRAFRRALGTLSKADQRIDLLRQRIAQWPDPADRADAELTLDAERSQILALRARVLAGLADS